MKVLLALSAGFVVPPTNEKSKLTPELNNTLPLPSFIDKFLVSIADDVTLPDTIKLPSITVPIFAHVEPSHRFVIVHLVAPLLYNVT